ERILPALTWAEGDGSIVIAPGVVLDPGVTYGVLSGDPPLGVDLRASAVDGALMLDRLWPPPDADGAGPFAIFCRDGPLAPPPPSMELDPGGIAATLDLTVFEGMSPSCMRLDLIDPPADGPGVAPPALVTLGDGSQARLDPSPIAPLPAEPPPP